MSETPVENIPPADGTVQVVGGKQVLRFERHLAHPIARVWAALTEPEQLIGWLAEAKIDLVEGGRVELRWQNPISAEEKAKYRIEGPDESGETPVVRGTITRLDPPRVLEYDSDSFGVLRWELREEGAGSVLTFTNAFPAEEVFPVAQTLAGWHTHLDLLEATLAGHPTDWPSWPIDRWAEHRDRYAGTLS
jgi:uncharacterized protein YndB with AHSA1/START domain